MHFLAICRPKLGVKFLLLHFDLQSFELAIQTSHPSLYSTKTLYLYISDPF